MATQVTPDGHVIAPMNISAPAPFLNLNGFQWETVDQKILGLDAVQAPEGQVFMQQAAPAPVAAPAPQIALASQAPAQTALPAPVLPAQLASQLLVQPGDPPPPIPNFPLAQFQGSYAGNGFNMIFRPRGSNDGITFPTPLDPSQPDDNILEVNLTTEQLTFGQTIGGIPNRGLNKNQQGDIFLQGIPYLQTVQDVTNPITGKGDNAKKSPIHFEPGMFLWVPPSGSPTGCPNFGISVARMASIPHGTTVNAQGLAPRRNTTTTSGGTTGPPSFDAAVNVIDTTPFAFGNFNQKVNVFPSMDATKGNTLRIPQNLSTFISSGMITTDIIKNPNLVLKKAIQGQQILETITFQVSTGPSQTAPGTATMNGGGTSNIAFLCGTQSPITTASPGAADGPNAHAAFMTSTFWIETVAYQVTVPPFSTRSPIELKPNMPTGSTAPTPVFRISPPSTLPAAQQTITVPGFQIQYSQTVNLNFGPKNQILTWPHVSVATLVPSDPQPFQMR